LGTILSQVGLKAEVRLRNRVGAELRESWGTVGSMRGDISPGS